MLNYALTKKRGMDLDVAYSVYRRYCTQCLMLVGFCRSIAYLVVYEQVSGGAVRSDRSHAKPRNTFCACPQPRERAARNPKSPLRTRRYHIQSVTTFHQISYITTHTRRTRPGYQPSYPPAMPTAHSRVTAHDRTILAQTWGSRTARLNRDSFLPFGACTLCLLPARDPVACSYGAHLFCRGCAIDNLLAQKQEIKRLERAAESERAEDAEDIAFRDAQQREKDVAAFEATQAGLDASGRTQRGHTFTTRQGESVHVGENFVHKGVKRKFELDKEAQAARSDDSNNNETAKSEPETSFWIPTKTPDGQLIRTKLRKAEPMCPAACGNLEDMHAHFEFSLKTLVSVRFSTSEDKPSTGRDGETARICPACTKTLSNATKAVLAKPCGHVLCKSCAVRFLVPTEKDLHAEPGETSEAGIVRCHVCQEDVTERFPIESDGKAGDGSKPPKKAKLKRSKILPGIVEIKSEGTGFAGAGNNVVKKSGIAFQC